MKTRLLSLGFFFFTLISFGQCFTAVIAGYAHNCAIKPNGTIWTWGWGNWGQQGNSTDFDEYLPIQLTNTSNWQSVTGSQFNTFGIKTNGTLWGCGGNLYGGMGTGSTADHISVMTQIGTSGNWKQVTSGDLFTLALKTDNSLWGWGQNDGYQMGNNNCCTDQLTPIQIGIATDWKTVGASYSRSGFAIKNNGTLWCWGTNLAFLLGDGAVSVRTVPTQHNTDTDWDKMSVGFEHILIIKTDGTLWAWGGGQYGQTGQDPSTSFNSSIPFQIAGTWKSFSAGFRFSMGIKTDGTLWGWGLNDVGQLGNGTVSEINYIPIQIGTATNWASVSCGWHHSVAQRNDGSLWSWGTNEVGQLGNGTTTPEATPTNIPIAGCTLGVEEFEAQNRMQISPNPVSTELSLRYKGVEIIDRIVLYDLSGREVYAIEAMGNNEFASSFSIAQLQGGTYLVVLQNKGKNVVSGKVVKE